MSETYTLCPYCQEKVDPQDSGVRYGVERVRIDRMGGFDLIDGMGGFFHPGCPMGAVGYVEREVSEAVLAFLRTRLDRDPICCELEAVAECADRVRLRDVLLEVLVDELGEGERRGGDKLPPHPLALDVTEPRAGSRTG